MRPRARARLLGLLVGTLVAGCGGGPTADAVAEVYWRADELGTIAWGHGDQPWGLEKSTVHLVADFIADLSAG